MILGTGIDISRVERFKKHIDDSSFLERFFPQAEVEYINSKGAEKAASLAARFSAREAFFKALGTGFREFGPKDITVLNNSLGKPEIVPGVKVKEYLEKNFKECIIHLSISHEKEYAVAQVILEA